MDYGAQIVFLLSIIIVLLFGIVMAFFAIPGPKDSSQRRPRRSSKK